MRPVSLFTETSSPTGICVRMTTEDKRMLDQVASRHGLTRAGLVRRFLADGLRRELTESESDRILT